MRCLGAAGTRSSTIRTVKSTGLASASFLNSKIAPLVWTACKDTIVLFGQSLVARGRVLPQTGPVTRVDLATRQREHSPCLQSAHTMVKHTQAPTWLHRTYHHVEVWTTHVHILPQDLHLSTHQLSHFGFGWCHVYRDLHRATHAASYTVLSRSIDVTHNPTRTC